MATFTRQLVDLVRGPLAALGQAPHFRGDHTKTGTMLARMSCLDGGIQGQQVGLVGDVIDERDLAGDLLDRHDRLLDRLRAGLLGWRRRRSGRSAGHSARC
jgi:hypothetical protein